MTLLDLMEVYKLIKNKEDVNALLLDMFQIANIDPRIDRTILAGRFLMDCGTREPRYNTTDTFLFFGSVWLQSKTQNISQWLDALDIEYNPLIEYEEHRLEDIDREHITNGSETSTLDRDYTDAKSSTLNFSANNATNGTIAKTDTSTLTKTDSSTVEKRDDGTITKTDSDARTDSATDEHLVSAENESGVQLRSRDTHAETITDGLTSTETTDATTTETTSAISNQTTNDRIDETNAETNTRSESTTDALNDHSIVDEDGTRTRQDTTTHDDTIDVTLSGRKTAAYDLIIKEMEKAKLNIYDTLIEDFADVMFLNVF